MPRYPTGPLLARILRAQVGAAAAERDLRLVRVQRHVREVALPERDPVNRRAYLAGLLGTARPRMVR
jgi:hypothetical protein